MRSVLIVCLLAGVATANPAVEVVTLQTQPAITKTIKAKPAELSAQIGNAVMALIAVTNQHTLSIAGPPFARTLSRGAVIEVEVGLPIRKAPSQQPEDARVIELPAGPAATFVFRGRHQDLPNAHATLDAWLVRNKRKATTRWEVYVTNPVTTPDPAAQQTRIVAPLTAR